MFVCFLTKVMNIQDSHMNATPKMGDAPPLVSVFHFQTSFFGFMCSYTPHLVRNPMLGL
jgi:hypothetical protein